MPSQLFLIRDRQIVGKATYNLRTLKKSLAEQQIPEPFKSNLIQKVHDFEQYLKSAVLVQDDAGNPIRVDAHGQP